MVEDIVVLWNILRLLFWDDVGEYCLKYRYGVNELVESMVKIGDLEMKEKDKEIKLCK